MSAKVRKCFRCKKKILPHLYVGSHADNRLVYYCLTCWKLTPAGAKR